MSGLFYGFIHLTVSRTYTSYFRKDFDSLYSVAFRFNGVAVSAGQIFLG